MKKLLSLLLVVLMALTLAGCGQKEEEAEVEEGFKVGVIQLLEHQALDLATKGFVEALAAHGVDVDVQNAQGQGDVCATIATGYVNNDYDLVMGNATPALVAARNATQTIPVLGTSVTDYAEGLQIKLNADGSTGINVSGTSDGVPGIAYAECLMESVPTAAKVAMVYCSGEPNSKVQAEDFKAAMKEVAPAVEIVEATFQDSNDMAAVITAAVEGVDALYIPTDNTAAANMTIVANICEPAGIPVVCGEENMCKAGGTVTVSISYYNIGAVCGEMAWEILNGADVSKMPIGYDNAPVKKYNAANVAAIGFTVPAGYEAIAAE